MSALGGRKSFVRTYPTPSPAIKEAGLGVGFNLHIDLCSLASLVP